MAGAHMADCFYSASAAAASLPATARSSPFPPCSTAVPQFLINEAHTASQPFRAKQVGSGDYVHTKSIWLALEGSTVPKGEDRCSSSDRETFLYRPVQEVESGAACQVEDLSSQPGGSDTNCSLSTARKEQQVKVVSQWGLQHCKSTCGQEDAIAATVCTWQTPSEAAALLEAIVMQTML